MATNQTQNYALNQWELSDSVIMAEFNSDNQKVDAALAALDKRIDAAVADANQKVEAALATATQKINTVANTAAKDLNSAIAAVTETIPRIQTGTFTVTETHTKDNPCALSFEFEPQLVILVQENRASANIAPTILLHGMTTAVIAYDNTSTIPFEPESLYLTWEGNALTWYSSYPLPQATYRFMAIA